MIPSTTDRASNQVRAVLFCLHGYFDLYDMVRSLGMAGIRPIVASRDKRDIAFFSRFCGSRVLLPQEDEGGDEAVLTTLVEVSQRLGERPVLYYSTDTELAFVWKHQKRLEASYRFLLPPEKLLEDLFDKGKFSLLAAERGLPIPRSLVLESSNQLEKVIDAISYPCIVKPAYQRDWSWDTEEQKKYFGWYKQALRRIDSKSHLREFFSMLPTRPQKLVVQRYLDGPDDTISSFHGYFDESSNCLASYMGRKIRTYPPFTGGSVYIRTILDEGLRSRSIGYLREIGHRGIVKIDYKWDAVEENFKILEINTRYNLWQVLGSYAGMNLMSVAFDHQCGNPPRTKIPSTYPDDLRFLFFKMDFRSYITGYRKTGEWTLPSYLGSIMRFSHYRVFNIADPFPSVVSAGRFVWRVLRRLVATITR